jgi:multiple antibiotic resistance protein
MLESDDYVKILIGVFVIVNPVGMLPAFLGLTASRSGAEKAHTARTAAFTAGCVLISGALFGVAILSFFGIGLPAFRVAGGILLLLVAIDMLHAKQSHHKQTPQEAKDADAKPAVGVVPLAIPLLAGPAAISTVILYANEGTFWPHVIIVCGIVILVAFVVWGVFRLASPIGNALGSIGLNIVTRLMGLILAAIAIEFISKGFGTLFPGWLA